MTFGRRRATLAVALTVATGGMAAIPIEGHAQRPHPVGLERGDRHETTLIRAAPPPVPRQDDRWFSADKTRHLGASAAIQIMGFGVLRSARLRQGPALVSAGVVSLAAGIGKELRDRRSGGDPSLRDLAWDVAGIALGSVLVVAADVR